MDQPTDNKHPRQFIDATLFKTYDAILALVKSVEKISKKNGTWKSGEPLIFTGSEIRLAKKNGTSRYTELRHIKQLVREGWLIKTAGQRRSDGSFGTNQYRVVTVEEWLLTHTYVQKQYGKHTNLRRVNARKHLKPLGIDAEPFVTAYLHPLKRSTVLQPSDSAVLQPSDSAVLQPSDSAVLQPCNRKSVVSKSVKSSLIESSLADQDQIQEQPQKQEQAEGVSFSSVEPNTAEAKPKATQPGRKRDVLTAFEHDRAKIASLFKEEQAEYESRPLCSKCGFRHYTDKPCIQETSRKK